MSEYIKTVWKDHVVDEDTQEIIQQGTPISARNLNNMESGIEKAVTQMSEIFPDTKLITINHNLKCYPKARIIRSEYGIGLGGLGITPLGGTESYPVESNISYLDRNNIEIYVPKKYFLEDSHLAKVSETQYILTFDDSVRSMLIDLNII